MIKVSQINMDENLKQVAAGYSNLLENSDLLEQGAAVDLVESLPTVQRHMPQISNDFLDCMSKAPKTIHDLQDGVVVETYEFEKGNEAELGLLGFLNVSLANKEKVTVVEYLQHGSILCNNRFLKYGVGCRLMMRIKSHKRGAKLNTPQQITASVIFDKAEVTFSMRTVGITGPGVAKLNKAGSLAENTYTNFMTEVSNLIVDMYKKESSYKILPQPLFLQ